VTGPAATKEGIQLCAANAERLLDDSTKTSAPTRVALIELALEEAAKGWMLYFRLMRDNPEAVKASGVVDFARSALVQGTKGRTIDELTDIIASFKDHAQLLMRPPLDEAFQHHRVKLAYVRALVETLAIVLPISSKVEYPPELLKRAIQGPARFGGLPPADRVARARKLFDEFLSQEVAEISVLKESGFYVDISGDGSFISPMSRVFKTAALEELADLLVTSLKGSIRLF